MFSLLARAFDVWFRPWLRLAFKQRWRPREANNHGLVNSRKTLTGSRAKSQAAVEWRAHVHVCACWPVPRACALPVSFSCACVLLPCRRAAGDSSCGWDGRWTLACGSVSLQDSCHVLSPPWQSMVTENEVTGRLQCGISCKTRQIPHHLEARV